MLENEKETRFDRFTWVFTLVAFRFSSSTVFFFTKRFLEQGVNTEKKLCYLFFPFSCDPNYRDGNNWKLKKKFPFKH
jgi:hypothetical protein